MGSQTNELEFTPDPNKYVDPPEQIVSDKTEAYTSGPKTQTVTVSLCVQIPLVPVTVYVVVVVGLIETLDPIKFSGCQMKDVIPVAVRNVFSPLHIVSLGQIAINDAGGFTKILTESLEEQPF